MAHHIDLGKYGEQLGVQFLSEKQFSIIHTNWKYSRYEIDLIASKNNVLHFIEIKTRKSMRFGLPEESADQKKMEKVMRAAEQYLYKNPQWVRVQYDVLSISISADGIKEFFFIEDVYYW